MGADVEAVVNEVQCTITDSHNNLLLEDINPGEVKSALFSMNPDNAPGEDGFC